MLLTVWITGGKIKSSAEVDGVQASGGAGRKTSSGKMVDGVGCLKKVKLLEAAVD